MGYGCDLLLGIDPTCPERSDAICQAWQIFGKPVCLKVSFITGSLAAGTTSIIRRKFIQYNTTSTIDSCLVLGRANKIINTVLSGNRNKAP